MSNPTPISHSLIRSGEPTLAVHDWGGTGSPTLLCHPTGFHGMVWAPVAAILVEAGRRVFSLDFRGHGDSEETPGGTYHWEGFADDVLAVSNHLQIAGDPNLLAVGHSKGAAAILLAEEREPGTFSRIFCYEPIVFEGSELGLDSVALSESTRAIDPLNNPMSRSAMRRRRIWDSRDQAYDTYASKPPLSSLHPDALRAYVDHGLRDVPGGGVELKCHPDHEASVYAMGVMNGLWPLLPSIKAPTVIACGESSDTITPAYATAIARRMPNAELLTMPGVGHFGPMQDPEAVAAAILRFAGN